MEKSEATDIITFLTQRYPNWLSGKSEVEQFEIIAAWAEPFLEFHASFETVLQLVKDCIREEASMFVPDVSVLCKYVRRALAAEHDRQRQNRDGLASHQARQLPAPRKGCPDESKKMLDKIFDKVAKYVSPTTTTTESAEELLGKEMPTTKEGWEKVIIDNDEVRQDYEVASAGRKDGD